MVQILAPQGLGRLAWAMISCAACGFFYFGWFHGARVAGIAVERFASSGTFFPIATELLLLWLVLLPFLQSRLACGSWNPKYPLLFASAWRNKLTLAEAGLFTALFWGLLGLWQMLFHLLDINYFRELFQEPIFIYPVTAVVFGVALHLIGSLEQWTRVVLEQLLSVLKWLALVAAVILTLFTVALLPKLSTLAFSGSRAIDAGWLLWLVAVVVLLLNAAFRDGAQQQPYPKSIARGLRFTMPLLVVVASTAAYALLLRAHEYGLTVERFWALIVVGFALLYALGYSFAAIAANPWMKRIAFVNICAALLMLVLLSFALTPVLSPYRLAADSQYEIARHWSPGVRESADQGRIRSRLSPFQYLRFNAGAYGEVRLRQLAGDAIVQPRIRTLASSALALKNAWEPFNVLEPEPVLSTLAVYPSGRAMSADLQETLKTDLRAKGRDGSAPAAGLFIDLDGDGSDEFVLLWINRANVYRQVSGVWHKAGDMYGGGDTEKALNNHLAARELSIAPRVWQDLKIGPRWYLFAAPLN